MHDIQLILTLCLLVASVLLLIALQSTIGRFKLHPTQRHRARTTIRYAVAITFSLTLVVLWADELRSAAIVLSAFAVAIVVASKELFTCLTGWWLKIVGGHFRMGDRVQIGDHKGDVIDYGILSMTLLEVDSSREGSEEKTGAVITLPNSMLLSHAVRNETGALSYNWHTVQVVVPRGIDWKLAEQALLSSGQNEWRSFSEDVTAQAHDLEERFPVKAQTEEPRVMVSQLEDGKISLKLRIGLPVRDMEIVEDRILRNYLDALPSTPSS